MTVVLRWAVFAVIVVYVAVCIVIAAVFSAPSFAARGVARVGRFVARRRFPTSVPAAGDPHVDAEFWRIADHEDNHDLDRTNP